MLFRSDKEGPITLPALGIGLVAALSFFIAGQILGKFVPLHGFEDVEGITYLGDDLLVVTEERQQSLVVLAVPRVAGPLLRAEGRSITLALGDAENSGFEGVGYDRAGDRLFVVKEHSPRKLYEIQGISGFNSVMQRLGGP